MAGEEVKDFLAFVAGAPSAFHAVEEGKARLEQAGFTGLKEQEKWQLVPGGKYYVTRNRSSLLAFRVPEKGLMPFRIVASHSDSPTFKLKPVAESLVSDKYVRLNTERYGGMILSSWLDRPLSIAGRVLVREGEKLSTRLVDLGRDAVLIPHVPIHLTRDSEDSGKLNPQVDMLPLYGLGNAKGKLMEEIATACHTEKENIVGSDLFLYTRMPGSVWGAEDAFFSCPRIDDLECAYTSLQAFLEAGDAPCIQVYALFDNEEVGSGSKQGAASTFLQDALVRISLALGAGEETYRGVIASSFMVSADNAHAVHPNHPEKYDEGNRTYMNGGVVIKHNANQRYTTDGVSAAIFAAICEKAQVPVQHFANRSDMPGGSTLGNIANRMTSMNTVDIGLAQLAMHSAYETAGTADLSYMVRALHAYYEADITPQGDGEYQLG